MSVQYTLREIVNQLGGELVGAEEIQINRVASLTSAKADQISFYSEAKYSEQLARTEAGAIIVNESNRNATSLPRIIVENPYAYFARVSTLLNPQPRIIPDIAASAVIDGSAIIPASCTIGTNCVIGQDVTLGEHVVIAAGCVIGDSVAIGANSRLHANVVVYQDCVIGQNCTILAGAVIGADGFGYAKESDRWIKIPQVGRVVIEDDVDVGVNTTIDRGTLDDTVIEQGAKLDNLIQIGHNCRIGAHTVIAGCVGIAGSARIGRHCRIGGAAMILGHLEIADEVTISPGTMITRSLAKSDTYTALMPFQSHQEWLKTASNIRRLSDLTERVKWLEKQLAAAGFPAEKNQQSEE